MASSSSGDFVMAVLTGAAVGFTIGLLYAPRPGEESRALLQKRVSDLRERAEDFVEDIKGTINRKPA